MCDFHFGCWKTNHRIWPLHCRSPLVSCSELFALEQFALDNFEDQRADSVMAGTGALQDLLNLVSVRETHRSTGRIDRQLTGKIARDLFFVVEKELLQFAHVSE